MTKNEIIKLGYDYGKYVCSEGEVERKGLIKELNSIASSNRISTSTFADGHPKSNPFKLKSKQCQWFGEGFTRAYDEHVDMCKTMKPFQGYQCLDNIYEMASDLAYAANIIKNKKIEALSNKFYNGIVAYRLAVAYITSETMYEVYFENPYKGKLK